MRNPVSKLVPPGSGLVLLKLESAHESPGDPVKVQVRCSRSLCGLRFCIPVKLSGDAECCWSVDHILSTKAIGYL